MRQFVDEPRTTEPVTAHLSDPLHGFLFRYWEQKRAGRPIPDRADIDPAEIAPAMLPHLMLLDLREGPAGARFRLIGTAIVDRMGRDATGKHAHEIMSGSALALFERTMDDLIRYRAPIYNESGSGDPALSYLNARRLHLPLSRGSAEVALALVGITFSCTVDLHERAVGEIYETLGCDEIERAVVTGQ
jgi:hypothetical protein